MLSKIKSEVVLSSFNFTLATYAYTHELLNL
nr:hypothetical protein DGKKSRWO_DGKKSRWO_CDS_0191 [uncultured phage]CAI9752369.1 hypothetical protein CVNMHQAP_CVNMHQAP_CDS_0192 [uncultured phage]